MNRRLVVAPTRRHRRRPRRRRCRRIALGRDLT